MQLRHTASPPAQKHYFFGWPDLVVWLFLVMVVGGVVNAAFVLAAPLNGFVPVARIGVAALFVALGFVLVPWVALPRVLPEHQARAFRQGIALTVALLVPVVMLLQTFEATTDPMTYLLVSWLVLGLALGLCWLPAVRQRWHWLAVSLLAAGFTVAFGGGELLRMGGVFGSSVGFIWALLVGMVLSWRLRTLPSPANELAATPSAPLARLRTHWPLGAALLVASLVAATTLGTLPCGWLDRLTGRSGCVRVVGLQQPEQSFVVRSSLISPDGQLLAMGNIWNEQETAILLYSVADGRIVQTLRAPVAELSSANELAFSADGTMLASRGLEGETFVWRVTDGSLLYTFPSEMGLGIGFSADGQVLTTGSQRYRLSDGVLLNKLAVHAKLDNLILPTVGSFQVFSPDRQLMVDYNRPIRWGAGDSSFTLRVRRTSDSSLVQTLPIPKMTFVDMAFSPDGSKLAIKYTPTRYDDSGAQVSQENRDRLLVWRVSDWQQLQEFQASSKERTFVWSTDSSQLLVVNELTDRIEVYRVR